MVLGLEAARKRLDAFRSPPHGVARALEEWPIDEAHLRMRVGIIRLNAFHGLVETPQRGYHETITRVWLSLGAAPNNASRGDDSRAFLELHPGLTREAPLRHYLAVKSSSRSKRAPFFVDPDLEPLPRPSRPTSGG